TVGTAVIGGIGIGPGGDRLVPVDERLSVAGGLEVAVGLLRDLGDLVELVEVHRIGTLGTGRHVGDLPSANRNAVIAGRDRVGPERHAVGAGGQCTTADGDA